MKKYVVPLFLAACLLLTACGPKAPDTAEPLTASYFVTVWKMLRKQCPAVRRAGDNGCADAGADGGAYSGADRRAALHRGGGDRVCPLRGQERRGKGAQPLAPFRREGHSGDLYPRRAGYADVYGPGCRA